MKHTLLAVSLAAALFGGLSAANAGVLKVGATPVPHAEILEYIQPALAKKGVELKITEFNDYVQPNLAVSDGELDANFFQHQPYLDVFVKDHGSDLVNVAGVHIEPMGIYSKGIKKLKDIKEGASVGIPNDPTNGGRALLLLAKAGLIKVANPDDVTVTVLDVVENPKKLKFQELEAAQLPRALPDVDFAVINTNYALPAGLNPLKDAIFIEDADSPYVNILVANSKSAKNPDLKVLIDELSSAETAKFITKKYNGAVVPVAGQDKK
ncbi:MULTISPECIES: MetQ/NlpA family ABC transporter substrate-binding protein [unclassified Anaerobiospirillum]|uniref:MetQ/NlpA family ABC transporter substrate-binding protein n=1 Tax=unclassified Anaerobiospirillum TaxID=2647410 RepID=UPI001FF330C2|nr:MULTISPECIES: MetQ/NlpA family ABC transporter substrate-binding protein [unclassified Anaerobiospirillum]MCK0535148.1 MetQ/NlpA family ABC transporter substrate-binding protein [Anaerobiospirillum sp. NML120511]MCK0539417.1 MetQ/NlpA family ABC transporter substrate-binding protein [Anaerobiospirillum sp. NML02-A-032]